MDTRPDARSDDAADTAARPLVPDPCATFRDFRRDYCHQLLGRLTRPR
ncbi:hypothetical protein [Thermoactinospora rubra]|nr:hypothetical protein [Thermoactinospora rubra]